MMAIRHCLAEYGSGDLRNTGGTYPWLVESTAMINHYYFYCVDEEFGPFFLKFYSYFPYNAKLCINGHDAYVDSRNDQS